MSPEGDRWLTQAPRKPPPSPSRGNGFSHSTHDLNNRCKPCFLLLACLEMSLCSCDPPAAILTGKSWEMENKVWHGKRTSDLKRSSFYTEPRGRFAVGCLFHEDTGASAMPLCRRDVCQEGPQRSGSVGMEGAGDHTVCLLLQPRGHSLQLWSSRVCTLQFLHSFSKGGDSRLNASRVQVRRRHDFM